MPRIAAILSRLGVIVILATAPGLGQTPPSVEAEIPLQLKAVDPDVRALITAANEATKKGDTATAIQRLQDAISECQKRRLTNDLAISEGALAAGYIAAGDLSQARTTIENALQHAADTPNLVLQAMLLSARAIWQGMSRDLAGNLRILDQALTLAEQSKTLYVQSHVLGERARIQLQLGKLNDARKTLEQALDIDELNHYSAEAQHRTYLALLLVSEDKVKNHEAAVENLQKSIEIATKFDLRLAAIQATSVLARLRIDEGKPAEGVELLEKLRGALGLSNANLDLGQAAPFEKLFFLEILALAYEAVNNPPAAFRTWKELYDAVSIKDAPFVVAEAGEKLADYCSKNDRLTEAAAHYSAAAQAWGAVGNSAGVVTNLSAAAAILVRLKKAEEAFAMYDQVRSLAHKSALDIGLPGKQLEFATLLQMSQARASLGDETARESLLREAQRMLTPDDIQSLAEKSVVLKSELAIAITLSVMADRHGNHIETLEQLFRAYSYATTLQDKDAVTTVAAAIREAVTNSSWLSSLEALQSEKILEAWRVSRIVAAYASIVPDANLSARAITGCVQIPHLILSQTGGAVQLEGSLQSLGDQFEYLDLAAHDALARYFLYSQPDPARALQHAKRGLQLVRDPKAGKETVANFTCHVALAQLRTNEPEAALKSAQECAAIAQGTSADAYAYSQFTSALVGLAAHDFSAADATKYIIQRFGDSPYHHEQLAELYAANHKPDLAISELNTALKLVDVKDVVLTARIHLRIAELIDRRSSTARGIEKDGHFASALSLYRSAHDLSGEAMALLDMGFDALASEDPSRALTLFQNGRDAAKASRDLNLLGNAEFGWASAEDAAGHLNEADVHFRLATGAYESAQNYERLCASLIRRSFTMSKLYRYSETTEALLLARHAADLAKSTRLAWQADVFLGLSYEQQGLYTKAIESLQKCAATGPNERRSLSAVCKCAISGGSACNDWRMGPSS